MCSARWSNWAERCGWPERNERVANLFHVTHTNGILALDPDLMTSVKNLKG